MGVVHKNLFWRDWMRMDIHCTPENNQHHFPEDWDDKDESKAAEKIAKGICEGCPALRPCLSYAIDTDTRFGIFGGMNYKERKEYETNQE